MSKRISRLAPRLSVLLLAAVLLSVAGYFIRDFRGVQLGVLGAVLWPGALLISFVLGTVYLSRVLLPIPGSAGWTEGFRLLWRHYLSGSPGLPEDEDDDRSARLAAKLKEAEGFVLDPSFDYLNAGILPSHEAAAVVRGNSYVRAEGPGLVILNPGEAIGATFDLRPHSRRQSITVNTRDGIPLDTSVSVRFQVRRPAPPPADAAANPTDLADVPYPYDKEAIFHLNYVNSIGEGDNVLPWTEQVLPQAATLLVNEIAKHRLDELLEMGGSEPLGRIKRDIRHELETQFQPLGLDILDVGVGALQPPEEVVQQRLNSWQVEWQGKMALEEAAGEAEAMRLMQQARARAQIDIIENLVQSIEAMRGQSDAPLQDIIRLRLAEVARATAADPELRARLPEQLLSSLAADVDRLGADDDEEDDE